MITTSEAWKDYAQNNFIYHIKATLTPSSGSALSLTDEDFMMGSVKFNDSTSDSNTFTIGAVITNTFECTLSNFNGKFDEFNFDGATISVQIGIEFENSSSEYITKGIYTVDRPSSLGSTIQLTCYDYADKLNKYYIGKILSGNVIQDVTFPINASAFAEGLVKYCGLTFDSWNLPNNLSVNEFEYDESTTCRQVLGWLLQMNGGFAKATPTGAIKISWYNAKVWGNSIDADGGVFNPWQTADVLNGGTMWVAVPTYDGGTMLDGASWELNQVANTSVGVDDIRITGVRAYAYGTVDEFQFETVGEGGYVLALQDNPLITESNMLAVATAVFNQCNELQFRIFDLSAWASPSVEAGDSCLIRDYRGRIYPSIITNVTYNLNGLSDMSCGAETPGENSLETANPTTQTIGGAITAAYDYLLAKKISADYITAGTLGVNGTITASDLEITGGEIGRLTIVDGTLTDTYSDAHKYTQEDVARAYEIYLGNVQPTLTDYMLLDVNGDGVIDLDDYNDLQQMVSDDIEYSSTIVINPHDISEMINITNSNNNNTTKVGSGGVDAISYWSHGEHIGDHVLNQSYSANGSTVWQVSREWQSGVLEKWVRWNIGNITFSSSKTWGNGYYSAQTYYNQYYPEFIGDAPIITFQASGSTGLLGVSLYEIAADHFKVYISDTKAETVNVTLQWYAIGRWK